jgi:uncharacterized repeat protein (TIGR01451 family)
MKSSLLGHRRRIDSPASARTLFTLLFIASALLFGFAGNAVSADLPRRHDAPLGAPPLLVCKSGCTYSTISSAVSASSSGDTIKVAQGTYNEVVQVYNKSLTIRGGYSTSNWNVQDPAAYETTINGGGSGPVVRLVSSNGSHTGTLDGFTIKGGHADNYGGGVFVNRYQATISNDHIQDNQAKRGGGVSVETSSNVLIQDNVIEDNTVTIHGGGIRIYQSTVSVIGNDILNNTASADGGGLTISDATVTLSDNDINGNVAQGYGGGGLMIRNGSDVTLTNNRIKRNRGANGGGGMRIDVSSATLEGNDIISNRTSLLGGGLAVVDSDVDVIDNYFWKNVGGTGGGGMQYSTDSTGLITGNRIIENQAGSLPGGGGVHFWRCAPELVSNIISGNTSDHAAGGVNIEEASPLVSDNEITDNYAADHGGGISVSADSVPIIEGNLIADNSAGVTGGGLFSWTSSPKIRFNEIVDNQAPTSGGVHLTGSVGFEVTNNIIARNKATEEGGGILLMSNSQGNIVNNTLVDNDLGAGGEAISCRNTSKPRIANNILVGHSYGVRVKDQAAPTVEYNDAWDNNTNYLGVSGNPGHISCNPHFVSRASGDYHLTTGSCVIDNGTSSGAPTRDFDGDGRPMDGDGDGSALWDRGADEFQNPVWVTKEVDTPIADPGDSVSYTITYRNNSSSTATGVVISDVLSPDLVNADYSSTGPTINPRGNPSPKYIWDVQNLAPGDEGTITITADVDPSLSTPKGILNTVEFSMDGYEDPFTDEAIIVVGGLRTFIPAVLSNYQ